MHRVEFIFDWAQPVRLFLALSIAYKQRIYTFGSLSHTNYSIWTAEVLLSFRRQMFAIHES